MQFLTFFLNIFLRDHLTLSNAEMFKSSTHPRPRPVGLGRGFMLHFYTCSAPTARFGLLYRNILFWNDGIRSKQQRSVTWTVIARKLSETLKIIHVWLLYIFSISYFFLNWIMRLSKSVYFISHFMYALYGQLSRTFRFNVLVIYCCRRIRLGIISY